VVAGASRPDTELSDAALLVLRDLDDADGKEVIRAGIKELVAAGAWRIRGGSVLEPGDATPPGATPLPRLSRAIQGGELRDLAKRMLPKVVVSALLEELVSAGLVETSRRRVRRVRHARTPAGDARLGAETEQRVQRRYRADPDARIDPEFDPAFDAAFDAGFTPELGGRKESRGVGGGGFFVPMGGDGGGGDGGGGDGGGGDGGGGGD
jgi:hypothetical protein